MFKSMIVKYLKKHWVQSNNKDKNNTTSDYPLTACYPNTEALWSNPLVTLPPFPWIFTPSAISAKTTGVYSAPAC